MPPATGPVVAPFQAPFKMTYHAIGGAKAELLLTSQDPALVQAPHFYFLRIAALAAHCHARRAEALGDLAGWCLFSVQARWPSQYPGAYMRDSSARLVRWVRDASRLRASCQDS